MTDLWPVGSRITQMVSVAASVAGQTELVEVLRTTVTTGMELTGARYGALGVIGEHGVLADFIYSGIDRKTADRIGTLPQGRGVLGLITREASTVCINAIADHPASVGFPPGHPPMGAFLGVPVRVGDRIFGNLYLTDKHGGFTPEDEALVEALAVIAGSAVATARLHERLRKVALVEDRERIARELHDSVIQELFAVGLSLQAAANHTHTKPDAVRDRILEAVDQLDQSITTLRQYIFDIRRRMWDERDLESELQDLAAQLAAPHNIEVRVSVYGNPKVRDSLLDDALQFVREGVSNAVRHSGAKAVDVRVEASDGHISLEVRDDGRGFDVEAAGRGMGLDNLIARARHANGEAEINSRPGAGTTVRAVLPLGSDETDEDS